MQQRETAPLPAPLFSISVRPVSFSRSLRALSLKSFPSPDQEFHALLASQLLSQFSGNTRGRRPVLNNHKIGRTDIFR